MDNDPEFQPFTDPAFEPFSQSPLATVRSPYAQELQNPDTAYRLYSLIHKEVGTQGPEAQQAFAETVFNRAAARGKTLTDTITDSKYYPNVSLKPANLDSKSLQNYKAITESTLGGSNISNYATGNASGKVGFGGGPQTFEASGERFGVEGPDRKWAEALNGGVIPEQPRITGADVRSAIESVPGRALMAANAPTEAAVQFAEAPIDPLFQPLPGHTQTPISATPSPAPTLVPAPPQQQPPIPTSVQDQAPLIPEPDAGVDPNFEPVNPSDLPDVTQPEPDIPQKTVRALGKYAREMLPTSLEGLAQSAGVPTDLTNPLQLARFALPMTRPMLDIGQQALQRIQQIAEADQTPSLSQQRFDAGIGTVLDLAGMAGMIGGAKIVSRPQKTTRATITPPRVVAAASREVPVPEAFQPKGATATTAQESVGTNKPFRAAAIRYSTGDVVEAPSHAQALADSPIAVEAGYESGFVTHDGRFVRYDPTTSPTERPEPQLSEPLQFSVDMPTDAFGTEHTPVSSALNEMKVLSKSGAKRAGKLAGNEALWNDAPGLAHPTHNKIYGTTGEMPDVAAQTLYDAGLISDPSATTMWNAVAQESKGARNALKSQRGEAVAVGKAAKSKVTQDKAFAKAERLEWEENAPLIPVGELQVGDTVRIQGETFKVTDIDPDTFDVTLEDGTKYGVQSVSDQTVIYGEHESKYAQQPPAATPPPQPPTAPPTQPQLPSMPEPPHGSEALNPVRGSGKFIRSYRIDKELGDRMEGIGAARESGALRAETESRNLLDGLSTPQEVDLGRYLVSRRLKTVNPDHPQILPESEMRRIESDPAIAKALDYYKRNIKPDIESWRKRAGLSEKAASGKEAEFISLIPKTMDLLPQRTAAGTFVNPAKLPRTTIFARAAQGLAREYNVQLRDILTESYGESIRKARTREFYDAAVRKGIVNKADVQMPDGSFRKVAQFDDLPPELQHDLTEATKSNMAPVGLQRVGQIYQRVVTGAALTANPAELVNHMRRQLNLVAAKPPIGSGLLARLEALVPYFGPKLGAFKRTIGDNMSSSENQAILKDIFDAGGGSTRSFGELYGAHPKRPFAQALAKYSGYEWLQAKTQKLLFGVPKGYGIQGWDLRMRVQLEKIRRSAEGNVDPQRIREFANQIGQYGRHNSWAVEALKKINPYAATTLPMRLTELNTAIGNTGLKEGLSARTLLHRGETLARGTGGTILALTTANYLLSGKWPWENDKGHEFDLNTGLRNKDGKTVYVKLRAIAPELSRPVSAVSLPELSRETTAKHPQMGVAAATGPTNQVLSLLSGPGQNFALSLATGFAPYMVKRPGEGMQPLDLAALKKEDIAAGTSRMEKQAGVAVRGLNPFGKIFGDRFDVEVPEGLSYIQEPVPGVRPFGDIYTQSYEKKAKPEPPRTLHHLRSLKPRKQRQLGR